jgi:hypothetical protein
LLQALPRNTSKVVKERFSPEGCRSYENYDDVDGRL